MANKNYWCFRVDKSKIEFFRNELLGKEQLRQGWGWDEKQDLRNFKMDEGAGRNRPMFNKVKEGDYVLIPQLPSWGEVAIVQATEDWNKGYRFEIDPKYGDYGHIFPAKYLKKFTRHNENVTGNLRSTLKNPSRFWNINHYAEDVERLISTDISELSKKQDYDSRLESSIGEVFEKVFDEKEFADKLYNKLIEQFTREEWEFALVYGLKKMFPNYDITREGGINEKTHGADILITIPSVLPDYRYAIAIQVKDYDGSVGNEVIDQINKSEAYWDNENLKLIDRIVIITKAKREINSKLIEHDKNVKIVFADDLKQILSDIGKCFIGMK